MPVDASIPLSVQTPQVDFASIYATAMQLKQMRDQTNFQNSLKAIFSDPAAIDPKTGAPTGNTLATIARMGPQGLEVAGKLSAQASEAAERRAQTEHLDSETQTAKRVHAADALNSQLDIYDAEVKGGNTDPAIALRDLQSAIKDYVYSGDGSDEDKATRWGRLSGMDATQLRGLASQLSMTTAERRDAEKPQIFVNPQTSQPETVRMNPQTGGLDVRDAAGQPVSGPIEKPSTQMDPERAKLEERRLALQEKVAKGGAAALTPEDETFAAEMVLNGQPMPNMGYGAAGAAARAKILHRAAEMATGQSGSPEAGADETVVRREALRADQASLTTITKQQASVRQFSQTALGLTDKIEAMMDNGTTKAGPEWIAGLVQKIRTGQLGDPDTREFLGYITDLESENAKIMAGATGSVAQVSAHNQALMNQIIKGDMPASEIMGALKTIRSGIELRNKSLDDEIARQKAQLRGDTAGGSNNPPPPPPPPREITATGPNGQKAVLKGDRWVDAKTGKPL